MSSQSGRVGVSRRRRTSFVSLVVAAVVVPVAIAYACNPQAHVSLDSTAVAPGQSITVNGSYFPSNATITVAGPVNTVTVTSSPGGGFSTSVQAPSTPGDYTITASRPTGGFAPASFSVVAPAAPAPAVPTQSAPAPQSAPSPVAAAPAPRGAFSTPGVVRSTGTPVATRPGSVARTPARTTAPASAPAPVRIVTNTVGQPVFAGSVPVAAAPVATAFAPAAAAPRSSASGSRTTPGTSPAPAVPAQTPASQAAISDLYSNYEPGRTASLMNDGMSSGSTGTGLGIALLAFGAFALVAGLSAAEIRRRRPA